MTIREFNLLEIIVYDGESEIYRGMCENAPEELLDRKIKVEGIEGKTLKIKLI